MALDYQNKRGGGFANFATNFFNRKRLVSCTRAAGVCIWARVHDAAGAVLDQALAVYMPSPHSYTGEDVVELQCHGGYLVCREILAAAVQPGRSWRTRRVYFSCFY